MSNDKRLTDDDLALIAMARDASARIHAFTNNPNDPQELWLLMLGSNPDFYDTGVFLQTARRYVTQLLDHIAVLEDELAATAPAASPDGGAA